jgi:hypothetical protein
MADTKAKKAPRAARRTLRGIQVAESVANEASARRERLISLTDAAVALPSILEAAREYLTSVGLIGETFTGTWAEAIDDAKSKVGTKVAEQTAKLLA